MRLFVLFILLSVWTAEISAQVAEPVTFDELETDINNEHSGIKVYNFWATFCRPCVAELPYFENVNAEYNNVDVVFVSLDFIEDLDSKVNPFLKKKHIQSRSLLLDDLDYNSWIDKINPNWSGAIPATLFVYNGKRVFHEGEMSRDELNKYIIDIENKIQEP